MEQITGIKSVDFKVTARGHGVVNWNGPTTLQSEGRIVDNHSLPKLRGYTNLTGKESDKGYKLKKDPADIDFKKNPLYISQNCIRHHLFREQAYDLHYAKDKNLLPLIASITGMIRGYVVPSSQCKRTSPLLIEDFEDKLGNGNFEQLGRSGSKDKDIDKDGKEVASNSFFSKTTFGETFYEAYGSISIEQLQFISLDKKFDRPAMIITEGKGENVATTIQEFIKSLAPERDPKAAFHPNFVRKGTIFEEGEVGILLDDTAIDILINRTLQMVSELSIRQAKGYMYVDEITVDYNNSHKMMRIKQTPDSIMEERENDYAVYFYGK
ncbi:type I-Fv CRISPR-associated protein Cas7fv [Endozoicomonas sp. 8E]|uniref:type I-Fv CRISPR-associated protein Cas7fv n=1 Tax=Endozoicomonas sp. 8E TaxID=3035692 RepID=UPI0029392854|nr:type I-Fv CRISPR-associated protein Cas7fv [Endozoicomonas sp. 8E]WOG30209.1 type I-Fv CRISPR-associated protein Cas7fv [Endozoicomonas sp. 8E]